MTTGLTTKEMARFIARGFLRFDGLLSAQACEQLREEVASGRDALGCSYGMRLAEAWPEARGIREIFALPRMQGAIKSLLGPDPLYDHHYPHVNEPGRRVGDDLHQDAVFDPRQFAFDVQIAIFPQETPREMGGTLIVPGSHLRRVNERDIMRYQHIVGQEQIVCPAGTVVFLHHNLWHSSRSNRSSSRRLMFKVRLQPSARQQRCWDLEDLHDPEVFRILDRAEAWHGVDGRIEVMNRLALFQYLSGEVPGPSAPHFGHYLNRRA